VSRPAQIRFLSRTAGLYDPVVRGLRFPRLWERIAELATPEPDETCLDVCTGTGGVALALASRGARVLALDAAPGMLGRAARKARAAGLEGRTRFVRMDARALALPDASFPLVTCCMALHEMSQAERTGVLAELGRVASGRLLVADYRVPRGAARWVFSAYHAYEYLESDDFESFTSRDLGARLAEAGLRPGPPHDVGAYRIWPCRVKPS
jgi:ubiquinone/menaquinone biosynthesis C-methylase UbiE